MDTHLKKHPNITKKYMAGFFTVLDTNPTVRIIKYLLIVYQKTFKNTVPNLNVSKIEP